MKKLAAIFVVALAGAVALPTIDLAAQTSNPPASRGARKGPCAQFERGSAAYKDCRAKANAAAKERQAACAKFAPKTAERRDCMAQQRRNQRATRG